MYRAKKVFLNTKKKKNETKQNKTNSHHLVIGEKQKQKNVCFISDLFIHEKQNQFVILYRHTHRERERD